MIKFKQKEFFLGGTLGAITLGTTGLSMAQAHKQGKEAEEQSEQQAELMREQNKQLERIAKKAEKNPEAGAAAGRVLAGRNYSAAGVVNLAKTLGQAGKSAFGNSIAGNVAMATGTGAATYGIGKYIQRDMKKEGMELDETGNLVKRTKKFGFVPQAVTKGLGKVWNPVKENMSKVGTAWKNSAAGKISSKYHLGAAAGGAAFGAIPLMGYKADKQQFKDQVENTGLQQERQYGLSAKSVTGFINNFASFGAGGNKNIQKFGQKAIEYGKANKSGAAQRFGEWITKKDANGNLVNASKANLVTLPAVAAIGMGSFNLTEKGIKKVGKAIDPGAYRYTDAKESGVVNNG